MGKWILDIFIVDKFADWGNIMLDVLLNYGI
jgi:hypothetical protein